MLGPPVLDAELVHKKNFPKRWLSPQAIVVSLSDGGVSKRELVNSVSPELTAWGYVTASFFTKWERNLDQQSFEIYMLSFCTLKSCRYRKYLVKRVIVAFWNAPITLLWPAPFTDALSGSGFLIFCPSNCYARQQQHSLPQLYFYRRGITLCVSLYNFSGPTKKTTYSS